MQLIKLNIGILKIILKKFKWKKLRILFKKRCKLLSQLILINNLN